MFNFTLSTVIMLVLNSLWKYEDEVNFQEVPRSRCFSDSLCFHCREERKNP